MSTVPQALQAAYESLLARYEGAIPLDVLGEAVSHAPVGPAEIEALMVALEQQGRSLAEDAVETRTGADTLRRFLSAARSLRERHGKVPTLRAVAEAAELDDRALMHAVLFFRALKP